MNTEFASLCEIQYGREYSECIDSSESVLNNFEDIVNHRVDIPEDIKRYQDTPSYASSKVDYSMGENIYMLPSNMKLNIRSGTVGYNNKILISDGKFSLGKNHKVNAFKPATMKSSKVLAQTTTTHRGPNNVAQKPTITHEEEKIGLILSLIGIFMIWHLFQ